MRISKRNRLILIACLVAFLISLGYHGFRCIRAYPTMDYLVRHRTKNPEAKWETDAACRLHIEFQFREIDYQLFRLKLEAIAIGVVGVISILALNWPQQKK